MNCSLLKNSYLKEFVVLAQIGNYSKAADALFIAQSALSKHIQALEKDVGVPLFDRTTRRIELTAYGQTLLGYAREMVNLDYQATIALENQMNLAKQVISIGSIPSDVPYGIADQIVRFQAANKNITVHLREDESEQLKQELRHNQIELAFIRDKNERSDEFAKIPVATDSLCAILPPKHPLAKRPSVSLAELKEDDFILLPPDTLLHKLCLEECAKVGFTPRVVFSSKRADYIIDLVEKGQGTSLLMRTPVDFAYHEGVSVVDIEPKITTYIQIYYKKGTTLSNAARLFISSLNFSQP